MDSKRAATLTRTLVLLGVLVLLSVVLVLPATLFRGSSGSSVSTFPLGDSRNMFMLVGGRTFLARDRGENGTIDCFQPTGFSTITCAGVYHAEDADCCKMGSGSRVLDDSLAEDLLRLLRVKSELKASRASVLDTNDDGRVDCVVSVYSPEIVHLAAPDGDCPTPGDEELTDEMRASLAEVLALEKRIQERVTTDDQRNDR